MTKAVSLPFAFSIYALSDGFFGVVSLPNDLSIRSAGTVYPVAQRLDTRSVRILAL